MHAVYLLLYVIAAVMFILAALPKVPQPVAWLAVGLLAWVLVPLIQTARH